MENKIIDYTARTPVWNGLGTDIRDCRTIREALEKSGLDFTVRQTDIVTDEENPISLRGWKANIKDDGTPLGVVSTRYQVVQNADAFRFLDGLTEEGMKLERAGGLQNGRKVFVLARMPEKYIISGESIAPYIVFMNAHDGTGSIKVLMTPVRMICLNMLNPALRHAVRSWSAVHSGDIPDKLEDAKNTLLYADKYMQELGKTIEELKHKPVTDARVIEWAGALYPVRDGMTEIQQNHVVQQRRDLLERYFHAPDLEPLRRTEYRFLNAVSDHATHADPIRRKEKFHEALFSRSVEGHPLLDRAYQLLSQAA